MTRADIEKTMEERIIRGEYAMGAVLPSERGLAAEFGVSKTVVHDALLSLQEKGFIESRARSGNRVADWVRGANADIFRALIESTEEHTTEELARSFAEFRVFNEGKCAALAAQKRTEEDLMKMRECLIRIENSESREDFSRSVAEFHHLIFNATGNRLYAVLFGTFMPLIEKWSWIMFPDWKDFDSRTLRLVFSCIEKRDAVTAEVTMGAYMTESAVRLHNVSSRKAE